MKRAVILVIAVVFLVLGLSAVALAATPQDIYNDYADNQTLDGTYTTAELQAYLADPWVDQYGDPTVVTVLDGIVAGLVSNPSDDDGRGEFPFTGVELTLMALAALALVGGGVGLTRLSRSRA
jgi:hypothetical protein